MAQSKDLAALAREAGEQIERSSDRSSSSRPENKAASRGALAMLVLVMMALLIAGVHYRIIDELTRMLPISRSTASEREDLDKILGQAKASVEAARGTDGSLPLSLPSASLAALVRYDRLGTSYRLSASGSRFIVTLDENGNRSLFDVDK